MLTRNLGIRPGLSGEPGRCGETENVENRGNVGQLVGFPSFQLEAPLFGEVLA